MAAAALAGALVAVSVTGLTSPSVTGLVSPSAARIAVHVPPGALRQARVVPAGAVAVLGSLNGLAMTATVVAVQPAAAGFIPGAFG